MKLRTLAITAVIALLVAGLAHGQTNTGFPPLPPVPKTGQLPNNPRATSFTFIVAGDNRPQGKTATQPKTLSRILNDAQRFKPAFFLWCGDTISGHTADGPTLKQQYQAFISIASQAKVPIFNAPGNHEMDTVSTDPKTKITIETPNPQLLAFYLQYMRPPNAPPYAYGAFNYGNSRFIAMNTEDVAPPDLERSPGRVVASGLKLDPGYVSQQQIDMLTQDLAANQDKAHIFVFMHHPIKPNKAPSGLDAKTAAKLALIFQTANVSYVLAAHEHLYYNANVNTLTPPQWQPGSAPIYLVTGGAGAPLDKCGDNTGYCEAFYHYLVFQVDGDTVNVQVVALPEKLKKAKTKKK
jgi:3',5'-cyclic AMP phosphodiesterase CpdA